MAKYTEERMFGMLTDIDRSEKRNAYKKYDLPTFKTGGNDNCPPNSYWDNVSKRCVEIEQSTVVSAQDYMDTYNQALALDNYMKNKSDYKFVPLQPKFNEALDIRLANKHDLLNESLEKWKTKFDDPYMNEVIQTQNGNLKTILKQNIPISEYYQELDANKFKQRELSTGILNMDIPMGYYDKRIPISEIRQYKNNNSNDVVEIPMYDQQYLKDEMFKSDPNIQYDESGNAFIPQQKTVSIPKKEEKRTALRSQTVMEPDPNRPGKYRVKELRQVPYSDYTEGNGWSDVIAPRVIYVDADGNETEERPGLIKQKQGGELNKFVGGGTNTCPPNSYWDDTSQTCIECTDERCVETDQVQQILDKGSQIPYENLGVMWDVVKQMDQRQPFGNAAKIWKNKGAQSLGDRLGMDDLPNCMWATGMGYQCLPETKGQMSLTPFESNDKFIRAVNEGKIPFERVTKTTDPLFDDQSKGILHPGDIVNVKGSGTSHALTFSHYRNDGTPIFLDSNGHPSDFGWNKGMWEDLRPGNGRSAYVSRFSPEMFYEKQIKNLEEKARTNPTIIHEKESIPYLKTLPAQPIEQQLQPQDRLQFGGALNKFVGGPPDNYDPNVAENNTVFLKSMINSPLFVERYARMVGKSIEEVEEEAEVYRQQMIQNLQTVGMGDSSNPPFSYESLNAAAYYTPPYDIEESNSKVTEIQSMIDSVPNRGKYNKETRSKYQYLLDDYKSKVDKLNSVGHKLYFKNWDKAHDLHERSHASTKGRNDIGVYDYNYRDMSKPRSDSFFDNLEHTVWSDYYQRENKNTQDKEYSDDGTVQSYYSQLTELKARKDVAAKKLQELGLYDPVNENFTEEHYKKLIDLMRNPDLDDNTRMQIRDIVTPFTKEDTIKMFNDIVQNEPNSNKKFGKNGGQLDKFVGGGSPGDKYYKNNGEQYKKTSAGQWFVWNPTYNNWQYADNGFHNNIDLEKYKTSYASDDASWENDKPKSNVAKPGTVPYYEEQRNKTLNSPFASYEQKMKATNSPLASNVAIRNNLTAQKAAEEAKVAAEKAKAEAKAEGIASWYEQEKEQRMQDALMFGNSPVQVADATRVDVDYLAPIVGEFRRAEADKQRQEDELFTTQEKVLKRGFKNIYDYENDPMGRGYDEALAAEARWRASGGERPMIDKGEMYMYQDHLNQVPTPDFTAGYNSESGYYNTPEGKYNTRTGQFEPTPQYYSGSGAIQGVDWLWTLPFAAPAAIEAIGSLAALEIPGMYGATLGSAANAGFIGHGLHSLPNTGASWYDAYKEGKGDYRGALENTMWNTLDFAGLGEARAAKVAAESKLLPKTLFSNAKPYQLADEAIDLGNVKSQGIAASDNAGMFTNASSTPDLKAFTRDPSKQYVRVNQQGMDDFLAQNPDKKVEIIRQDDWPGVLNSDGHAISDPLNQTRTLQKSEFDQATEFGTKWAVKDPVGYQKMLDDVADLRKRRYTLLQNNKNIETDFTNMQYQWFDDYLKEKNIGRTREELQQETIDMILKGEDTSNSAWNQVWDASQQYQLQKLQQSSPEVQKMYQDVTNLRNNVRRINTQISTMSKDANQFIDPTFKDKVEIIYDAAGKPMPSNPGIVDINGRASLVYGSEAEPSFLNLPLEDQQYLLENWNNIGGARTGNKTITLGSRPDETVRFLEKPALQWEEVSYERYPFSINDPKTWKNAFKKSETGINMKPIEVDPSEINPIQIDKQSMVVPETVGGVQAHEVGHDLQKFYDDWIDSLQEYRPELEYYTGHNRNPLAKEFNEAMVNPTAPVPNPMVPGGTKQSTETWKSSVGELHSELMKARYNAAKHLMAKKYSDGITTMDGAIAAIKKLEAEGDQALFDFYLDSAGGNLTKHFKGETSDSIKKLLIQILPGVVPAAVVTAAMSAGESGVPENRYGGNIKNLSKFIKK